MSILPQPWEFNPIGFLVKLCWESLKDKQRTRKQVNDLLLSLQNIKVPDQNSELYKNGVANAKAEIAKNRGILDEVLNLTKSVVTGDEKAQQVLDAKDRDGFYRIAIIEILLMGNEK